MEGFIILDYVPEFPEGIKQLAIWMSQGKIKGKNTIVKGGIQRAEYALNDLFKGLNTGKYPKILSTEVVADVEVGKLVVEVKEQ